MKYCQKCGNEIMDEAVICPKCGCATGALESKKAENTGLITAGLIFAWLMPIVGLIIGIVGTSSYTDPALKSRAKAVILVSICAFFAYFFIGSTIGFIGAI